jgi:hypothetical protein
MLFMSPASPLEGIMLATATTSPADDRPLSEQERMERFVEDIISLNAEGAATFDRLYELGWPPKYIEKNLEAAKLQANKRFVRNKNDEPHRSLPAIQNEMADIIGSLLPSTQMIVAELQARGFSAAHIDLMLERARATAALAFCHGQTGWAN